MVHLHEAEIQAKGQVDAHNNGKEESTGAILEMKVNSCQYIKGSVKVTITCPPKGNVKETELVNDVKIMMETLIMQRMKENEGGNSNE